MESQKKIKVLILYNKLFHYRIPIFELLANEFDLTVAYSEGPVDSNTYNFKTLVLPIYRFNRFVIHRYNIFNFCQKFDVVIAYGDIAWLNLSTLTWHKHRNFKIIYWSIGVSASYDKAFDSNKKWDSVRYFFYKRADALVFYTDYPFENHIKRGYSKEKLFVAPNTVDVLAETVFATEKDSILFIGTLYLQKGLKSLLQHYKLAFAECDTIPNLNIVGGGEELESVKTWITENGLLEKIILHGPVFDKKEKSKYFLKALACISPDQAGLSVLESMGYGVPFITNKDSITGGERLNIENWKNGVLMDNPNQLKYIILDLSANPHKYIEMGSNARSYYTECRQPKHMAKGLKEAIKFVLK